MKGNYLFWLPRPIGILMPVKPDLIIPNLVTDEGEQEYLKMIFRDETEVVGGGNFYIGLCNQTPTEAMILADINTEPSDLGGYERQIITRNLSGWPTLDEINGHTVLRSDIVEFAAIAVPFSTEFSRAFLCNAASGEYEDDGILFSFSGALSSPITLGAGQTFQMQYETYLD